MRAYQLTRVCPYDGHIVEKELYSAEWKATFAGCDWVRSYSKDLYEDSRKEERDPPYYFVKEIKIK